MFDPVKAEAAYKIMMRRKWGVCPYTLEDGRTVWRLVGKGLDYTPMEPMPHLQNMPRLRDDPWDVIIDADKWYAANVEQPANLPLPTGEG